MTSHYPRCRRRTTRFPRKRATILDKPFTGDLDEMVKRRLIRAGVVYNRTQYFIDKGVQRGISYESIKLFEEQLNKRLKTGLLKVHVAIVPLPRDQLFPALLAGQGGLRRGGADDHARATEARRLQHADAHRRLGDRRDGAGRGGARDG